MRSQAISLALIIGILPVLLAAPAKRAPSARELAFAKKFLVVVREKFKKGKIQEARNDLQKMATSAPPEYIDNVYFFLGKCYFYLGEHTKAYKIFNNVATRYKTGDIVRKRTLQSTLLDIIEGMSSLETNLFWERFTERFDARGKPIWETNRNFERINFRPIFKYAGILEGLDPLSEETVRSQEHISNMLNMSLKLKVVDYKSVAREGLHPNNWRTTLTPEESKLFSEFISSEIFVDWVTPHLGQVVGMYDNVVDGRDHFEVSGSLVLGKLFKAADYDPRRDRFGASLDAPAKEAGKPNLFLD